MKSKYSGMTVNERLYLSGLIDQFDRAEKERDVEMVISILKAVDLDDESISANLRLTNLTKAED